MKQFLSVTLLLFFASGVYANIPVSVGSSLKSVTVFRTGAEMNHSATATLKQGDNELTINDISSFPDIASIQVNCPAVVTIIGMEYSNNFLGNEIESAQLLKLKDSAESLNETIERLTIRMNTNTELLDVLKKNKEVKGAQTGLSVAELTRLLNYYETKTNEIQNDQFLLTTRIKRLKENAEKIDMQMQEEQKKNTKAGGRLLLNLHVATAGNYDFAISYITKNAYWTPYYDIKADNIKSPLRFVHKARIHQTTGIDWKKVKLTLSTSTPSRFGNAPVLKTWFLSYINPYKAMDNHLSNVIQGKAQGINLRGAASLEEVVVVGYGTSNGEPASAQNVSPLYIVNGAEMPEAEFKKLNPQIFASKKNIRSNEATAIYGSRASGGAVVVTLKDGLEDYVTVTENELDFTYEIDIPYDVPTNGKAQIATLLEKSIPAAYKYYSVPKLDKDAYLLAEIVEWQNLNLLPGEANVIFEGTYIGKTFIDPANTNDTLNITLGTDKRVVVKKEKVADFSSTKFIGSNQLQTITYDISVKNNKKEPIYIILKDQYPISTTKEIEVELKESSNAKINEETGVLTWMVNIEPGQSKKYRVSYSAKYPKGKTVNLY